MERTKIKNELNALLDAIVEQSPTFIKSEMPTEEAVALLLHKLEKLQQSLIIYNYVNSLPEILLEALETELLPSAETTAVETNTSIKTEIIENATTVEAVDVSAVAIDQTPLATSNTTAEIVASMPEVEEKTVASTPIKSAIAVSNGANKKDIKTIIGFNEKFLFTNELFNGDSNDFATALSQLNNSDNLISAKNYLDSLQSLYNWNTEMASYKRLVSIVEHLFA